MSVSRYRAFLSAILPVICIALASVSAADDHSKKGKTSNVPAIDVRQIPITRVGYGKTKPDMATIEVPFKVEAEIWEEVNKKQEALSSALQQIVKPFDPKGYTVPGVSAQSGQSYHDDKKFTTMEGYMIVTVRDLTHLAELFPAVQKLAAGRVRLKYHVTDSTVYWKTAYQAQADAMTLAKRDAGRLAAAAGTKIVGVLEIREGRVQSLEPMEVDYEKSKQLEIPSEILVISAWMTVTYELAPSPPAPPAVKKAHP